MHGKVIRFKKKPNIKIAHYTLREFLIGDKITVVGIYTYI